MTIEAVALFSDAVITSVHHVNRDLMTPWDFFYGSVFASVANYNVHPMVL